MLAYISAISRHLVTAESLYSQLKLMTQMVEERENNAAN
jgi:hypothetical protein